MDDSAYRDESAFDKNYGQKGLASKFGTTYGTSFYTERGSDNVYGEDPVEKHKKRILKKTIASVPSLDKDIRNILIMALQRGPRHNAEEFDNKQLVKAKELITRLLDEASKFMDTENAQELSELLNRVIINRDGSYDTILRVLKLYLVSSVEKNYVERIDEEINVGLRLDDDVRKMAEKVKDEKTKKSKTISVQDNVASQLKLIEQYENKIEKANQKLNEKMARSNEIRQKIDQLRKDNLVMEQVQEKLETELQEKQKKVEDTIQHAGYAYIKRNEAEEELKELKDRAIQSKIDFESEMEKIKEETQEVEKFKEFIKSKNKEKKELENLKAAIMKNKRKIEEKINANTLMEKEYNLSAKKEEEIKTAFERIMEKTEIKEPEDLLMVFHVLYEKNQNMTRFVQDLEVEIEGLDQKIAHVKQEIQHYSVRGATNNNKKREEKTEIIQKLEQEDKKKRLYKAHYENLIETLNKIKDMVEKVFVSIGADETLINKIKNSALTEDNMVEFIGILEQKGINLVAEYSRLLAEQLKFERGDITNNANFAEDINNLNNIIAFENANVLLLKANSPVQNKDFPDELLLLDGGADKESTNVRDNLLSPEQLQQMAMSLITAPNRKPATSQPGSRSAGAFKGSRIPRINHPTKITKKQF